MKIIYYFIIVILDNCSRKYFAVILRRNSSTFRKSSIIHIDSAPNHRRLIHFVRQIIVVILYENEKMFADQLENIFIFEAG